MLNANVRFEQYRSHRYCCGRFELSRMDVLPPASPHFVIRVWANRRYDLIKRFVFFYKRT